MLCLMLGIRSESVFTESYVFVVPKESVTHNQEVTVAPRVEPKIVHTSRTATLVDMEHLPDSLMSVASVVHTFARYQLSIAPPSSPNGLFQRIP